MKIFVQILGLGLLLFGQPRLLSAQETQQDCQDILRIRGGSKLVGQIQSTKAGGDTLVFRTWNGIEFDVPKDQIQRIVQDCKNGRGNHPLAFRPYNFREKGLYNHTRAGFMIGQAYYGENRVGLQLQHSIGWMFRRYLGTGLGLGVDFFDSESNDPANYPVYAEVRGYLLPQNMTPYYAIGGGWAFTGQTNGEVWGQTETWKGGWMAFAEIGYRIGNNLTVHGGIRFQHKKREWTNAWSPDTNFGVDRILYKRLMLGIGLVL